VFGTDYPTPDGTCVRDYIHVQDLAAAHLAALARLEAGRQLGALNLGTGQGYSVREVIETAQRVSGCTITTEMVGRRPGDPATLVAAAGRATEDLGWRPRYSDLETIIRTAWEWRRHHPHGYGE